MHAFIAVIAGAFVAGLAVYAVHVIMGPLAWVGYCVAAFFLLMAGMAKVNAT